MSFLRHARSIGPMGQVKTILRLKPCGASRWSAPGFAAGRDCNTAPSLIVRDESHRLFLGRLLPSRACLRFTGCLNFAMKEVCWSRSFHRAAMSELTGCLRPGVHPSFSGAVMAFVSTSVSITSIRSRRSGARRQL